MLDRLSVGILRALAAADDRGESLYGYAIRRDIEDRQHYNGYVSEAALYSHIAWLLNEALIHRSGDVVDRLGHVRKSWVITRPGLRELDASAALDTKTANIV